MFTLCSYYVGTLFALRTWLGFHLYPFRLYSLVIWARAPRHLHAAPLPPKNKTLSMCRSRAGQNWQTQT